jgi:hypothetical protein
VETLVPDVEGGAAVEDDDPLILVLQVVDRSVESTAQNLVDHGMVQCRQPMGVLARGRGGIGLVEPAVGDGHENEVIAGVGIGPRSALVGGCPGDYRADPWAASSPSFSSWL